MPITAGELQELIERRGMRQDCPRCTRGKIDFFVEAPAPDYAGPLDILEVEVVDGVIRMQCLNCGFQAHHRLAELTKSENP